MTRHALISPVLNATAKGILLALFAVFSAVGALAQGPRGSRIETVSWAVSVQPGDTVKQGGRAMVALNGTVLDGWHVYSQDQLPRGPIAMSVALDSNPVAALDGATAASTPTKAHDASFNLDTQYYSEKFSLKLPLRINPNAAPGKHEIPFSVLFQSCDGKVCLIPKTVRLTATINIQKAG